MSTSKQPVPRKKRRPLRKLLSAAVLIGIGVAIKNAIADKGGSYAAPSRPTAVPTAPPKQAAPVAPESAPVAPAAASGASGASEPAPVAPESPPVAPVAPEPPPAASVAPEPPPVTRRPGPATTVVTAEDIVAAEPAEGPQTS